ncbi:MAG TPA: NAD(P)/FAD-dependent oxidoreductase [Baekduia sp.]|uniref:FAD-dependent oxidoreductase n=1 Tax=Baekduia sp. TaxID=2600305 RepID=UPI002D769CE8|nr:NAD(P)/FAD-dependent oxidoreductase [Baekduia sp.]HET6508967.1 NAD(P)/FAD-dependent oxidoreductase [Baekduia sp.]
MSSMLVLIAGGGISGLLLAQGLKRSGIDCVVLEREPADRRRSGYRLTLDADGGNALEACLPPALYELYLRASHVTPKRHDVAIVIDSQGRELTTAPHLGPPNDGDRPHTAIDRRVFRQILEAGLADDGTLRHDAAVTGFEQDDDRVHAILADGSTLTGDVLVGADGVGSAVRRALLPDVAIVPAPVGGLDLFGRSPVDDAILAALPETIASGFTIARDERGGLLAMGGYVPRQAPDAAAAAVAPGVRVDPIEPYMMILGGIRPGTTVPDPRAWTADTPRQMHAGMMAVVADWHPAIRGLVERVEPGSIFAHPFRRLDPTPAWPTSRVTLVGDSIHAMLPTLGKGANMAMRNAAALRDALVTAARGDRPTADALAAYEADMRAATYPIMELAADHGRFGGGGLRKPERAPA